MIVVISVSSLLFIPGSLDKRNDVTFNRPCQTRSTATTLEHRPNKVMGSLEDNALRY